MDSSETNDELPLAWTAILADTPVYSADEQRVGILVEVLGAEAQDIFHGIVVEAGASQGSLFVAADRVRSISDRRIVTDLAAEDFKSLPVYVPEESYHLGFTGFLRRHLGWVPEGREGPSER